MNNDLIISAACARIISDKNSLTTKRANELLVRIDRVVREVAGAGYDIATISLSHKEMGVVLDRVVKILHDAGYSYRLDSGDNTISIRW